MASIKLKKGDEYWCVHPRLTRGGDPLACKIIAFTTTASKQVGVEFAEDISGGHSCDGRGSDGKCLWVRVSDLTTDDMVKKLKKDAAMLKEHILKRDGEELEEIEVEI